MRKNQPIYLKGNGNSFSFCSLVFRYSPRPLKKGLWAAASPQLINKGGSALLFKTKWQIKPN